MAQEDVEIVLLKQLASCLRIPISILGSDGSVLFFNEPAESIFGRRFDETGGLDADEWQALIQPSDAAGAPLKAEERPVIAALERGSPSHGRVFIRARNNERREIEITAIPLVATGNRLLGALTLFWERPLSQVAEPAEPAQPDGGHAVETILTRRLAATLAMPIFLVDSDGGLVYFNRAAEAILGHRFDDFRLGTRSELYGAFQPRDASGNPIGRDEHPLSIARLHREPVHERCWIRGRDGREREIAVTAIPLVGHSNRQLGAFGIFWEIGPQ